MNLQLARTGRLKALENTNLDRILVAPAKHRADIRLPDEGTVAAYLIDALGEGSTPAQIQAETGWSKATVMVNLFKVAKKSGVGIQRENGKLGLLLPKNARDIYPRQRDITRRFQHGSRLNGPMMTGLAAS